MLSPVRVILATTTMGIAGQEGQLLRQIGPLVLIGVLMISLVLFAVVQSIL